MSWLKKNFVIPPTVIVHPQPIAIHNDSLIAGTNMTIDKNDNTFTFNSTGGGGGGSLPVLLDKHILSGNNTTAEPYELISLDSSVVIETDHPAKRLKLSVVPTPGPTGPTGLTGPTGPAGADSTVAGPQGIQGIQGPVGLESDHIYVDWNQAPPQAFTTIQAAIDSIPLPTLEAQIYRTHVIHITGGTYNEDLVIDIARRKVSFVTDGVVNIGAFSGANWSPTAETPACNITVNVSTTNIVSVRPSFSMSADTRSHTGTHQAYVGGFRVSGKLNLVSAASVSTEISLEGVTLYGYSGTGAYDSLNAVNCLTSTWSGNLNFYANCCRFLGPVLAPQLRMQWIEHCQFDKLATVAILSHFESTVIAAGMTWSTTGMTETTPSGFYGCNLAGPFTGPNAQLLYIDFATKYWIDFNGATLIGAPVWTVLGPNPPSVPVTSVVAGTNITSVINVGGVWTVNAATQGGGGGLPTFTNELYVDANNVLAPFQTIQAALNSIPLPTIEADCYKTWIVHVAGGTYDENLTVNIGRKRIVLITDSIVNIGLFSSANWTPFGTDRTVTVTITDANIADVRSGFSMIASDARQNTTTTQQMSGFRISGTLAFSSAVVAAHADISLQGVSLYGLNTGWSVSTNWLGILNFDANACWFAAATYAPKLVCNTLKNCKFDVMLTCTNFSRIDQCHINGLTWTQLPSNGAQPHGIFNSVLEGTFTGPGPVLGTFRVDKATQFYSQTVSLVDCTMKLMDSNGPPVLFRATKTSTSTNVLGNGDFHDIVYDNIIVDNMVPSCYDPFTGIFTVPAGGGTYLLTFAIACGGVLTHLLSTAGITVNGVFVLIDQITSGAESSPGAFSYKRVYSHVFSAAGGETIRPRLLHQHMGSTKVIDVLANTVADPNYFTVIKI